jgi:hypothetical protein
MCVSPAAAAAAAASRRSDSWRAQVATAYFGRLLNSTTGTHVVYTEDMAEPAALDMLATHMIDFAAGGASAPPTPTTHRRLTPCAEAFFQDGLHTHEDLLGVYGARYIAQVLPDSAGRGDGADDEFADGTGTGTVATSENLGFLFIGLFGALLAVVIGGRFAVAVRNYKPPPASA